MTFSGPERWNRNGQTFLEISVITHQPFDLEWPNFAVIAVVGEGRVFRESKTPHSKGRAQRTLKFLGPPINTQTVWLRVTKFDAVTHIGKGHLSRSDTPLILMGGAQRPPPPYLAECQLHYCSHIFFSVCVCALQPATVMPLVGTSCFLQLIQ